MHDPAPSPLGDNPAAERPAARRPAATGASVVRRPLRQRDRGPDVTKKALVTGITGQDGSYLAELLLAKGYEVHGLIRRSSSFTTGRIDHLYQDPHEHETRLFLHYADLTDPSSLFSQLHQEPPRRGGTFVTRKVTRGIASILAGQEQHLYMGNLEARRDWGFAPEYVEAMWRMLQQEQPDDYVIATGEMHSVREFVEVAFGLVGLDWERYVRID